MLEERASYVIIYKQVYNHIGGEGERKERKYMMRSVNEHDLSKKKEAW